MGDLLFYLLKSGCYLIIFYLLFKLLMSGTTFFRFNRVTILAGIIGCMFLPLIEFTTQEETFLTVPLQTIQGIFVEQADGIFWDTMFWVRPQVDETGNMQAINWCPIALGYVYLAGGLFVLCRILLSFYRMFQLIRNGKRRSYGKYKLIVVSEPISSFCWGKYIVVSVSDYSQQSTDGILLHETMHLRYRHTLDLLCMQCLLILYWFNPAIWLLKRELQEVHEFEADNGVLNTGIDATRYQLLLVKKAVGTRLYSMANGFNHSKLKKRITMMLKERTNRWARLKLLFVVPVIGGALYAFAQPEVKEVPRQIQSELQQKEADDYSSLMFFFKEGGERYSKLVNGAYPPSKIKARQVHSLFVNKQNRVMFDNDVCSVDELKSTIVKNLTKSWEESKRKEYQVISFQVDRGSEIAALTTILKEVKGAFEQIRADLSITLTDKSEEALDRLFPVLLSEGATRNYGLKELSMEEKISGIVVTIHTSEGKEVMKDYTLTELKQKVTAARAKQAADPESLVIGLKIEKGCKMGYVTDTKQVLRECSALKINYSTDN